MINWWSLVQQKLTRPAMPLSSRLSLRIAMITRWLQLYPELRVLTRTDKFSLLWRRRKPAAHTFPKTQQRLPFSRYAYGNMLVQFRCSRKSTLEPLSDDARAVDQRALWPHQVNPLLSIWAAGTTYVVAAALRLAASNTYLDSEGESLCHAEQRPLQITNQTTVL